MDNLFSKFLEVVGKWEGQDIINFAGRYMVGNSGQQIRQNRSITALMNRAFFYFFIEEYEKSIDLFYNTMNLSLRVGLLNVSCTCAIMYTDIMQSKFIHRQAIGAETLVVTIVLAHMKQNKSAYWEASSILHKAARDVPKLKRDPNINPFVEDQKSPLIFIKYITSKFMPSSEEPDDVKLALEMEFRDYLRGLMMLGRWRDAILEFSNVHNAEKYSKFREVVLVPNVKLSSEIGLRFFHNTNEDYIGVVIKIFGQDIIYAELNTPSIKLFETFAIWQEEIISENSQEIFSLNLWKQIFGSPIQKVYNTKGHSIDSYLGLTIHEIAQNHKCQTLKVIPHGILFGLPLSAAGRKENGQIRYAIQDYSIVYYPPWKLTDTSAETPPPSQKLLLISGRSNLSYAKAEIECIKNIFSNEDATLYDGAWYNFVSQKQEPSTLAEQIIEACENAALIHFACHGTFSLGNDEGNSILINDGAQDYSLQPKSLFELHLHPSCSVFLNCCNSVSANPTSITESYTLPVYFLAANAKNIIATTRQVKDIDSFRIGQRYWERISQGNVSLEAFRNTLLECIDETLPSYIDELNKYSYHTLAKETHYKLVRKGQASIPSWMSYTYWENYC